MKKNIVVIGSSNVDLIMKMDRLPKVGETVTDADFMQVYGGKGANQAVAASKAGGRVVFVNAVGDDAYTEQMLKDFVTYGLDISYIFREKEMPSGHALVMIGSEGKNYLSVAPGANYTLTPERIHQVMEVIKTASILIIQNEIPKDTIEEILKIGNELKIPVLWNFAPAKKMNPDCFGLVDCLAVNEVEAEFLSGFSISDEQTAKKACEALLELGPNKILLTLGKMGSLFATKNEFIQQKPFWVDAVDTTAAGDVYCGAYAVGISEGKSVQESMLFASAASALCVSKMGAQPSIPNRIEIDTFLAKHDSD